MALCPLCVRVRLCECLVHSYGRCDAWLSDAPHGWLIGPSPTHAHLRAPLMQTLRVRNPRARAKQKQLAWEHTWTGAQCVPSNRRTPHPPSDSGRLTPASAHSSLANHAPLAPLRSSTTHLHLLRQCLVKRGRRSGASACLHRHRRLVHRQHHHRALRA